MTGSTMSLYLEETKTPEDSVLQTRISPIKREVPLGEPKTKGNRNMSTRARGTGVPLDALSPSALELHKVLPRIREHLLRGVCVGQIFGVLAESLYEEKG